MMQKGEYYNTLSKVIESCENSNGFKPSAVILGPRQYEEYSLEIAGAQLMGLNVRATRNTILGVQILVSPTSEVNLVFDPAHQPALMENLVRQETTEELSREET